MQSKILLFFLLSVKLSLVQVLFVTSMYFGLVGEKKNCAKAKVRFTEDWLNKKDSWYAHQSKIKRCEIWLNLDVCYIVDFDIESVLCMLIHVIRNINKVKREKMFIWIKLKSWVCSENKTMKNMNRLKQTWEFCK